MADLLDQVMLLHAPPAPLGGACVLLHSINQIMHPFVKEQNRIRTFCLTSSTLYGLNT